FILLIFPLICIAEVRYKILDLTANANFPITTCFGNGINNKGDVVGKITTDSQYTQIFTYKYSDNEGIVILGDGGGVFTYSSAHDINNLGVIVGGVGLLGRPSYIDNVFIYTPDIGYMIIMSALTNEDFRSSTINDKGQIVIAAETQPDEKWRSFRFTPGIGIEDLGMYNGIEIYATDINNKGWITGEIRGVGTFLYKDDSEFTIVCPGIGTEINDNGTITGDLDIGVPFVAINGEVKILLNSEFVLGYPGHINNYDCVVGMGITYKSTIGPYMWNKFEGTVNLINYIDFNKNITIMEASGINDFGQIICDGDIFNEEGEDIKSATFRLDPIPPKLDIKYESTNVVVSWLPNWPGLFLEQADSLGTTNWTAVSQSGTNVIVLPKTDKQQFFRLNIQAGRGLFWGP
ncbi:MAG TPA: hypothetical protein PLW02_08905, partial [Verrucomicrobiota bacterium]|nr:hypothetical protein [Verrucomicrobiota bacterium]